MQVDVFQFLVLFFAIAVAWGTMVTLILVAVRGATFGEYPTPPPHGNDPQRSTSRDGVLLHLPSAK